MHAELVTRKAVATFAAAPASEQLFATTRQTALYADVCSCEITSPRAAGPMRFCAHTCARVCTRARLWKVMSLFIVGGAARLPLARPIF